MARRTAPLTQSVRQDRNAERMCRETCLNARFPVAPPKRTKRMESNMRISSSIAVGLLVTLAGCATHQKVGEKDWFTAWAMSHNARATTPAMSGRTVRMILMPSTSGNSVRVKLENTMGRSARRFLRRLHRRRGRRSGGPREVDHQAHLRGQARSLAGGRPGRL
jgi:hypothetical protein